MANDLMKKIASDLKINRFKNETEEEFGGRLIYSSLAAWARTLVLGKSYTDIYDDKDADYHEVDKMHIQVRLAQIARGLLMTLPYSKDWLNGDEIEIQGSKLASGIIEDLLFCYELSKLNNSKRLTNSPTRLANFTNMQLILGGYQWKDVNKTIISVGLGRWTDAKEVASNYKEVFNITSYSAKEYYDVLLSSALWQESNLTGQYKIFKIGEPFFYNRAWQDCPKTKLPQGVSLLKSLEVDGGYLLAKKDKMAIFAAGLERWYEDEGEIFRIMYALNSYHKTPVVFKVVDYEDYAVLHCQNLLPNPETRILLLSSWPKRRYKDRYYRVIPKFIWTEIKSIFENLGIKLDIVNVRGE